MSVRTQSENSKRYVSEYLESSYWPQLKEQFFAQKRNNHCLLCNTEYKLLPHHLTYKSLWDEFIWRDLVCLCLDCHNKAHFIQGKYRIPTKRVWLTLRLYQLMATKRPQSFRLGTFINHFAACIYS